MPLKKQTMQGGIAREGREKGGGVKGGREKGNAGEEIIR